MQGPCTTANLKDDNLVAQRLCSQGMSRPFLIDAKSSIQVTIVSLASDRYCSVCHCIVQFDVDDFMVHDLVALEVRKSHNSVVIEFMFLRL